MLLHLESRLEVKFRTFYHLCKTIEGMGEESVFRLIIGLSNACFGYQI